MLGKGGVGKSTVSAALGLAAATAGRRALLVEISGSEHASGALGAEGGGTEPSEIADNLFTVTIDVDRSTEEYLASQLPLRPLVDLLVQSRAFHHFTTAAPGLAELVTVGAIWKLAVDLHDDDETPVWDYLVVDCPATGHGIALLETAANIRDLAGDGPIHDQAGRIEQVIRHPAATGVALVALPDELPVSEAVDAHSALSERGLPVALAVLNRTSEERFLDEEAGALTGASLATSGADQAAAVAALHHLDRQAVEAAHAERLIEHTGLPLLRLPELPGETVDMSSVSKLAAIARAELWGRA